MSAISMQPPPAVETLAEQLHGWAMQRFEATGASIDRMTAAAIETFCRDPDWTRQFVTDQIRHVIISAVAGHRFGQQAIDDEFDQLVPVEIPAPVPASPGQTRSPAPRPIDPDKPRSPRAVMAAVKADASRPPKWAINLAVDPDKRILRPMLQATREELLSGATWLDERSELIKTIADRLEPGQRVEDVWSSSELETLLAGQHALPATAE